MVSTSDFPQADRLNQVGLVADAIHSGCETDSDIENYIGLNSEGRQGRYYRLSAEILGLIINAQNQAHLTPLGAEYAELNSVEAKSDFLARCLVETDVFKSALSYIHTYQPTNQQLKIWFRNFYPGAQSTADRRFITFQRYLEATELIKTENGKNIVVKYVGGIIKKSVDIDLELTGKKSGSTKAPSFANSGSMTFNIDLQKREKANQTHWKLIDAKSSFLNASGLESFENKHIDLFSRKGDQTILYEMKSINSSGSNTLPQVRKAISQLYEYRYIFNEPKAKLCIVTNSELRNENVWLADYLSKDREIAYEWTEDFVNFSCPKNSEPLLGEFFA